MSSKSSAFIWRLYNCLNLIFFLLLLCLIMVLNYLRTCEDDLINASLIIIISIE